MAKRAVRELGRMLPDRIRLLSRLIARKPAEYTPEWASTINDAFRLYTRTSTVNGIHALNRLLIDMDWPFPAYVNLRDELAKSQKDFAALLRWKWLALPPIVLRRPSLALITIASFLADAEAAEGDRTGADAGLIATFRRHRKQVFAYLMSAKVLETKHPILADVHHAFERKMWAACVTTALPLLDFTMRSFFATEDLKVTLQVLRDAFIAEAKLRPQDLMPGYAVWDGKTDPETGNTFAQSLEDDLRLPGIFLSSFFEFADRYYGWYKSAADTPQNPLNRHAIIHCASEFWTEGNAVKIISFLDLTIRLETVLKVLIHGDAAVAALHDAGA